LEQIEAEFSFFVDRLMVGLQDAKASHLVKLIRSEFSNFPDQSSKQYLSEDDENNCLGAHHVLSDFDTVNDQIPNLDPPSTGSSSSSSHMSDLMSTFNETELNWECRPTSLNMMNTMSTNSARSDSNNSQISENSTNNIGQSSQYSKNLNQLPIPVWVQPFINLIIEGASQLAIIINKNLHAAAHRYENNALALPLQLLSLLAYPPSDTKPTYHALREIETVTSRRQAVAVLTAFCLVVRYCSFDLYLIIIILANLAMLWALKNSARLNMMIAKNCVKSRVGTAKQWAGGWFRSGPSKTSEQPAANPTSPKSPNPEQQRCPARKETIEVDSLKDLSTQGCSQSTKIQTPLLKKTIFFKSKTPQPQPLQYSQSSDVNSGEKTSRYPMILNRLSRANSLSTQNDSNQTGRGWFRGSRRRRNSTNVYNEKENDETSSQRYSEPLLGMETVIVDEPQRLQFSLGIESAHKTKIRTININSNAEGIDTTAIKI
jgi:hypothetical protein